MVTKSGKSDQKTISGTAGIDIINWQGNSNIFNLGNGNDQLFVLGDFNICKLGNGNDNLNVTGNSNRFFLGNGNDNVAVRGTSNVINLGNGDDYLKLSGNSNIINGEAGSNTLNLEGTGNEIRNFKSTTILNASFGNRIYGSSVRSVLNGDTSARFEGNNNRIRSEGVTNIEIVGDGNEYNYNRRYTKKNPSISNLNFGITVKGNNNKIIEFGADDVNAKYRETSSLTIIGEYNTIEAQQAKIDLNSYYGSDNTISGNNNFITYSYRFRSQGEGLYLDGQNIDLDLVGPDIGSRGVPAQIFLSGLVDVEKSLTIMVDSPSDAFCLYLNETMGNTARHTISIISTEHDLAVETKQYGLNHSVSFKRGNDWIGLVDYIRGNDYVYYNGSLIFGRT